MKISSKIAPCLWYDNQAEEAAKFYIGIFKDCFSALLDDPDTALGFFANDIRDGFYLHEGFAKAARRACEQQRQQRQREAAHGSVTWIGSG